MGEQGQGQNQGRVGTRAARHASWSVHVLTSSSAQRLH